MTGHVRRAGWVSYIPADGPLVLREDRGIELRAEIKHSGCCRIFKTNLRKGGAAPGRAPGSWVIMTSMPTWARHAALLKVLRCSIQHKHSASTPTAIAVCVAPNWLNTGAAETRTVLFKETNCFQELLKSAALCGRFLRGNKKLWSNCSL